jgi:hypothetical protein
MADPLNYQPSHSAAYYTPPSRFEFQRLIPAALGTAVVISGGAIAYSKIEPNVSGLHFRLAAAAAFAVVVGVLSITPVRIGKVRSPALAATIGALLSLLALWVAWIVWVHEILYFRHINVHYSDLVSRPSALWHVIQYLNRSGVWIVDGEIQRGLILWLWWFGEGAMVVAAGTIFPTLRLFTSDPICTHCGSRCKRVPNLPNFAGDFQPQVAAALDNRAFDDLLPLPAPVTEDAPEVRIRLMSCPSCRKMNVLTLNRIAWTRVPKHRATVKTTPIINELLITPQEAQDLIAVAARIREQRQSSSVKSSTTKSG